MSMNFFIYLLFIKKLCLFCTICQCKNKNVYFAYSYTEKNSNERNYIMKKIFAFFLVLITALLPVYSARADIEAAVSGVNLELSGESACLMEASTGEILYEQNPDEHLEPASVTKIMSLLLICEALDDGSLTLSDMVTGSDKASSMGGSQIWLEPGEQMSVDDMVKAMVVVSANDCTVAMAEHLAGSEEAFVARMNKKAAELGMANTNFVNSTGLPIENHYTTARDIALMTRELLKHEVILNYTGIWMDSLRNGEMGLSNTNKLIRFYPGANGMKTGYTDSAKYCLSATAKREKLQLIAVVMKAPSSDERFSDAKKLLDFGFANFSLYSTDVSYLPNIKITGGVKKSTELCCDTSEILVAKGREGQIVPYVELPEKIKAPVNKGDIVGTITYKIGEETVAKVDITAAESVKRAGFLDIIKEIFYRTVSLS